MNGQSSICVECNEEEKDASKLITCMYCFSEAHYSCRNIVGKSVRRIKERVYFCSNKCSSIYQRIVEMQNSREQIAGTLITQLKGTIAEIVSHELLNVRREVNQITDAIEKSQEFLSTKFDAIVRDFLELKNENVSLKRELVKLKETQRTLSTTVHDLEHQVDKTNRDANCNNAIILGVPSLPGENVQEIVHKMITSFGAKIESDAIVSVSRLYSNNKSNFQLAPIRVVFKNKGLKESIFRKKREHGKLMSSLIDPSLIINGKPKTVTIRDELTPLALGLLNELRACQERLNIKYVWPSGGGTI